MLNDSESKRPQVAWPFPTGNKLDKPTITTQEQGVQGDDLVSADQYLKKYVLPLLPAHARDVERLQALLEPQRPPTITVIGKYNHGKSRLLNELIGQSVFKVEDKRTTVALEDFVHDGVRWLDAPGLDADVASEDDRRALLGTWLESDVRLFVHAAKEGELDAHEQNLLEQLRVDDNATKRQTLLVLSQVDQLATDAELSQVRKVIASQVPGITIHLVSSTRYRQGLDGSKKLLLERSGLPELQRALVLAVNQVQSAREHEVALLSVHLEQQLTNLIEQRDHVVETLRTRQAYMKQQFDEGLSAALVAACRQLEEV